MKVGSAVLRQLELVARQEGATPADLIRRLFEAHIETTKAQPQRNLKARLPLIPASESGPIQPIKGEDVDAILG